MQFSAREDVEAPIDAVFRAITDFEGFERAMLRRGAEIARTDSLPAPGQGMSWQVQFDFRNRRRSAEVILSELDIPNRMVLLAKSGGVDADFKVDLVPLSRSRTRMDIVSELTPTGLSARLFLQPLKLARSKMSNRFRKRVAKFAVSVEDRYQAGAR
ncbi:MAG TPA: SRPBCC family protein [Aliiroseovarius sp.]|nr:SRPBCC family protein [Aliiroseovarius sp.]